MKCQILFFRKIIKNIILLSAEFAYSAVSVNQCGQVCLTRYNSGTIECGLPNSG